jgi:hypothetical protein
LAASDSIHGATDGKVVTVAQLLTFLAVLLAPSVVNALVIIVSLLGLTATVDYTLMLWRERVRPASTPVES